MSFQCVLSLNSFGRRLDTLSAVHYMSIPIGSVLGKPFDFQGITAAILTLALHRMGHTRNALYDGSWVEWGAYPDLAVETG